MAITWGATSGYFRLGIDIKVSGTRATVIVYGQSVGYGHNWTYPLHLTGSWSGSRNVSFYSATGQTVTKQLYNASYSFTGRRTYGANISYWNGSASVSRSVTISPPPKPQPPATPNFTRIRRVSDTQHVLEWTHSGGATNFPIERRDYNHGTWSGWRVLTRPGGAARSFTDTTTLPERSYQWRLSAVNSDGRSAVTTSYRPTVATTPSKPAKVEASRDGKNILVSWDGKASNPYRSRWEIERSISDGAWTNVLTLNEDPGTRSWLDTATDLEGVVKYRIRQSASTGLADGDLVSSSWVEAAPVVVSAPPNAPLVIHPSSGSRVPDGAVKFEWKHNPTDGSKQTGYEFELTQDGEQSHTATERSSSKSFRWAGVTPGTHTWRVRTKGSHASYGEWSSLTPFEVVARPLVTIETPENNAAHKTDRVTVAWTMSHEDNPQQHGYRVSLYDKTGLALLGTWTGSDSSTSFEVPYNLEDGESYYVSVEAMADGIWSQPALSRFDVQYVPPAVPVVDASWDDGLGAATLYVDEGEKTSSVEATDHIDVYRSEDGGETWFLLAEGLPAESTVIDYQAPVGASVLYRAVAVTSIGAPASSTFEFTADSDKLWISAGPGYAQTIGLQYNPEASGSVEAERVLLQFDGRRLPVPVAGVGRSQSMELSGWILEDEGESLDMLLDLIQGDFVTHLVRIPGRSVYGIITSAGWDYKRGGAWPVSFTIHETEREGN